MIELQLCRHAWPGLSGAHRHHGFIVPLPELSAALNICADQGQGLAWPCAQPIPLCCTANDGCLPERLCKCQSLVWRTDACAWSDAVTNYDCQDKLDKLVCGSHKSIVCRAAQVL